MTEPTEVSTVSAAPYSGGQVGPGRSIRMAREAAGLSLEELATQMRLARATLDALERDDFSTLSEPVYIRGYYRKCAKTLNLSESELLAGYERLAAPKAPPAPTKLLLANSDARAERSGGNLRWLLVLLLAFLIGAAVFLSTRSDLVHPPQKSEAEPAVSSTTEAVVEPLKPETSAPPASAPPSSAAPATVNTVAPSPPTPVSSAAATSAEPDAGARHEPTPAAPAETPRPVEQHAAPAVDTAAATAPSKPSDGVGLSLHFRGTSWVRVQDATGKMLLSGVIENGERQTVIGLPPYSIFLGNAPAVDVEYNGQPFKLDVYIKGNSTARFSVPAVASSN